MSLGLSAEERAPFLWFPPPTTYRGVWGAWAFVHAPVVATAAMVFVEFWRPAALHWLLGWTLGLVVGAMSFLGSLVLLVTATFLPDWWAIAERRREERP